MLLGSLLLTTAVLAEGDLPAPSQDVFQQDVQWSADGSWVAFSEFEGGEYSPEKWAIYVARADGSERRRVADYAQFVAWAPDGERLAFTSGRDGNKEIYSIAVGGGDLRRLTHDAASDSAPAWSPDGTWLAFSSDRDGNREIYVMATDGSAVRRLTTHEAADYNPSWSPDGREIAFYRELNEGVDQVLVVAIDGAGARTVTPDGNRSTFPGFLPNGRIAFSCDERERGRSGIVHVAPDGTDRREIGPAGAFWARWSPDGETVAFVAGSWPESAVYTMKADGTGIRKIVN